MDNSKLPPGVAEYDDSENNSSSVVATCRAAAFNRPSASNTTRRGYEPTVATARPAPVNPKSVKTSTELSTHLTRCAMLLGNELLMQKMPAEKASDLVKRYAGLVWFGCGIRGWLMTADGDENGNKEEENTTPLERSELYVLTKTNLSPEIRERVCTALARFSEEAGAASAAEMAAAAPITGSSEATNAANRESFHAQYPEDKVVSFQEALMESQRFQRVDLHEQLTRSLGDLLSKTEITRLVATSSQRLLLTFDESQKMEERFANMERQALIRRLRQRMAVLEQAANPPQSGRGSTVGGASSYDARDFGDDSDEDVEDEDVGGGLEDGAVVEGNEGEEEDSDDDEGGADVGANVVFGTGVRSMAKDGTSNGIEEDDE